MQSRKLKPLLQAMIFGLAASFLSSCSPLVMATGTVDIPARPILMECPTKTQLSGVIGPNGDTVVFDLTEANAFREWINAFIPCLEANIARLDGHIEKLENRLKAME